jgi:hypothetical protein
MGGLTKRRHTKKPTSITKEDGLFFDDIRKVVYIHVSDLYNPAKTTIAANTFRIKTVKCLPTDWIRLPTKEGQTTKNAYKAKEMVRKKICNQAISIVMKYIEYDIFTYDHKVQINRTSENILQPIRHHLVGRKEEDVYLALKTGKENIAHIAVCDTYSRYSGNSRFLNMKHIYGCL